MSRWILIGLLFISVVSVIAGRTIIRDDYINVGGLFKLTNQATCTVSQDGTGDYTDIQSCIDYACPNGDVYVKNGTYTISDAINISSNCRLRGAGINNTIIKIDDDLNISAIVNEGSGDTTIENNIVIEDLTIDGNKENNPGESMGGISFYRVRYFQINRVLIKDVSGWAGIYSTGYGPSGDFNFFISDVIIENIENGTGSAGNGIYMSGPDSLYKGIIDKFTIRNTEGRGLFLEDFPDDVIVSNGFIIDSYKTGLDVNYGNNIQISNVHVENTSMGYGIQLGATNNTVVMGCISRNNFLDGLKTSGTGNQIIGGYYQNNTGHGIRIGNNANHTTVIGTNIRENTNGILILTNSHYNKISFNDILDNTAYGIDEQDTSNNNTITFNTLENNPSGNIRYVGSQTQVFNNQGDATNRIISDLEVGTGTGAKKITIRGGLNDPNGDAVLVLSEGTGTSGVRLRYEGDTNDATIETDNGGGVKITQLLFDRDGHWTQVGNGTAQHNITLTSPDTSEWCCGVSDAGAFSCSTGACS